MTSSQPLTSAAKQRYKKEALRTRKPNIAQTCVTHSSQFKLVILSFNAMAAMAAMAASLFANQDVAGENLSRDLHLCVDVTQLRITFLGAVAMTTKTLLTERKFQKH